MIRFFALKILSIFDFYYQKKLFSFLKSRGYKKFDVLGKQSPMDQFNGLSYLGNRWVRNISFIGRYPYIADIKVKNMMKKVQQENIERRDELVEILDMD